MMHLFRHPSGSRVCSRRGLNRIDEGQVSTMTQSRETVTFPTQAAQAAGGSFAGGSRRIGFASHAAPPGGEADYVDVAT